MQTHKGFLGAGYGASCSLAWSISTHLFLCLGGRGPPSPPPSTWVLCRSSVSKEGESVERGWALKLKEPVRVTTQSCHSGQIASPCGATISSPGKTSGVSEVRNVHMWWWWWWFLSICMKGKNKTAHKTRI